MAYEIGEIVESRFDRRIPGLPHARAQIRWIGHPSPHLDEKIYGLEFFPDWRHLGRSNGQYRGTEFFRPRTTGAAIFLTSQNIEANFRKLTVSIGDTLTFRNGDQGVVRFVGDVGERYPCIGVELHVSLANLIGETNGSFRGRRIIQTEHPGTAIFLEGQEVARSCEVTKKLGYSDNSAARKLMDKSEASLFLDRMQMQQEAHTNRLLREYTARQQSAESKENHRRSRRQQSHPPSTRIARSASISKFLGLCGSTKTPTRTNTTAPEVRKSPTLRVQVNVEPSCHHSGLERLYKAAKSARTVEVKPDTRKAVDLDHDFKEFGRSGNVFYYKCERCGGLQGTDEKTGDLVGPSPDKYCKADLDRVKNIEGEQLEID
ncbi:MAG: hypothetical protein Q9160_007101 [Pyrenula sp. 1 TL-2023]